MVVVSQSGDIVLVNVQAEKQFGYSRDELIGRKVIDIIPIGFAERLVADKLRSPEEALAQVIGTGIELTALRRDGGEFPIEIMLSPLESVDGILVTAAIRDISVRKVAEADLIDKIAELKRSNEELSSSPRSLRTICRNRCGWFPATPSCSRNATSAGSTPTRTSSSLSRSTGARACSG
jgi:PAS domain S-box-containing protein